MPRTQHARPKKENESAFSTIKKAIGDMREGRFVILVDDEDRENEGDLILAAEKVTPAAINFLTKNARGLVCLALTPERVEALDLPMMVPRYRNGSPFGTAFTVSVEAREGVTTGISAHDRAHTVLTAIQPGAKPSDLVTPGHIFPLRSQPGGVLRRAGHTEGAVDLARLAGLNPAGVLCEVLKDDGSMARLADLAKMARRLGLSLVTIKDLIAYRMQHERLVERMDEAEVDTGYGRFHAVAYRNRTTGRTHLALTMGALRADQPTLVRVQPVNAIWDLLGLLRTDCSDRTRNALSAIQKEGRGAFVYLQAEPSPEDGARPRAGSSPAGSGRYASSPDFRDYGIGAQILVDLGLRRIQVLTNDERRLVALGGYGLQLEGRVPVGVEPAFRRTGPKPSAGDSYFQRP
ncbi:MAG: 3,4-dihydroxy-2-butanone-4-phosphate synthase [Candidatus Tectomicrobia bacterium]|uniref:3,4-dihydroxy-2-butanone 4-phosphate synthase n=1 Tax=Tectimicrobiota bacterium TaxID=2528274 RepID=A0A933E7I4_UNCTE|nr:3,4-dihydroxy-2-butanone-4-phosphate synthase [Candidatus Tectomicrobia bacterium]